MPELGRRELRLQRARLDAVRRSLVRRARRTRFQPSHGRSNLERLAATTTRGPSRDLVAVHADHARAVDLAASLGLADPAHPAARDCRLEPLPLLPARLGGGERSIRRRSADARRSRAYALRAIYARASTSESTGSSPQPTVRRS